MRSIALLAGLLLASVSVPAAAAAIVQNDNEYLFLGFDPFDPSLGTLNSVSLSVSLWRPRVWTMNVPSNVPATGSVDWVINGQWVLPASTGMGGAAAYVPLTGSGTSTVNMDLVESGNAYGFFGIDSFGSATLSLDPAHFLAGHFFFNGYDPGYLGLAADTTFTVAGTYGMTQLVGACMQPGGPLPESEDYCGSASYTLTYDYTPAVPEPGTWAMMLLGFGAIGLAMRRRRIAVAI